MIKLVAVDMDGTFLNGKGDYARQRFAEQYQQLKQRNIKFVVASGNQYYQLKSFFPDIDAELAYVAENGAYVVDQQREIYCGSLPDADVKRVINVISQIEGVNFLVCGRKWAWMLASAGDEFFNEMRVYYHMLEKIDGYDRIDDTIFKFALSYVEDDVSALMAQISDQVGDIVTPVSSGHGSVDLIIPGNHKANGIRRIQQIYGVADDDVLAFGDGGNDLEMLRYAGFGFAMANGSPAAKAAARYAATANDEEGVLAVIDDMLQGRAPFNN